MRFKRNITVTLSCIITECLLSLIPTILILCIFLLPNEFNEIISTLLIVPYFILIINFVLLIITLISRLFIKTTYYLKDDSLEVVSPKKQYEIHYHEIYAITYDLGDLTKFRNHSSQLVLFDKEFKELLSVNNPPIVMVHLLKRKCQNAKVSYYHGKRFLYLTVLINGTAMITLLALLLFVSC